MNYNCFFNSVSAEVDEDLLLVEVQRNTGRALDIAELKKKMDGLDALRHPQWNRISGKDFFNLFLEVVNWNSLYLTGKKDLKKIQAEFLDLYQKSYFMNTNLHSHLSLWEASNPGYACV
jgi:hypothetical protein